METSTHDQTIILNNIYLGTAAESFLISRRAENLSPHTIKYYRQSLTVFCDYCETQAVKVVEQITADVLRRFMLWLEETGHNPGGVHGYYRGVRAFLNWYEVEVEPENWKNPIRRVKAPRVPKTPLEPVSVQTVSALLGNCKGDFFGLRDRLLLLLLLDTGARASEVCSMDLADCDQMTGAILVRQGKGQKSRTVYLGSKSRKALRAYVRARSDKNRALLIAKDGERLTYWGLEQILKRRAERALVSAPTPHSFRRAFALNCLRAGMDIYSLKELMGHEDLQVLRQYLKLTSVDLETAHKRFAPVDNLL
jgi:site-specific recombinase XerD